MCDKIGFWIADRFGKAMLIEVVIFVLIVLYGLFSPNGFSARE